MALYLQLRAGPVHLMIDAAGVHEIVTQVEQSVHEGIDRLHAQWRGQVLSVVPLARFLGFADTPAPVGVVWAADADALPLMLAADEVIGLQQAVPQAWRALPTVPEATAELFDAIYLDPADPDRLAYRLRTDLDPSAFGVGRPLLLEA